MEDISIHEVSVCSSLLSAGGAEERLILMRSRLLVCTEIQEASETKRQKHSREISMKSTACGQYESV